MLLLLDLLHYHFSILDVRLSHEHFVDYFGYRFFLLLLLLYLLPQSSILLLISLGLIRNSTHQQWRDLEILGDVSLEDVIYQMHFHDCISDCRWQLFLVSLHVLGSDSGLGSNSITDLYLQKALWIVFYL